MRAARNKFRLTTRWAIALAALAVGCAGANAVQLNPKSMGPEFRPLGLIRVAGGMSIDQAVEMVERKFQARVVRAEAREEDGRTIYILRLLNDSGRVWIVRVDATSGAVL